MIYYIDLNYSYNIKYKLIIYYIYYILIRKFYFTKNDNKFYINKYDIKNCFKYLIYIVYIAMMILFIILQKILNSKKNIIYIFIPIKYIDNLG